MEVLALSSIAISFGKAANRFVQVYRQKPRDYQNDDVGDVFHIASQMIEGRDEEEYNDRVLQNIARSLETMSALLEKLTSEFPTMPNKSNYFALRRYMSITKALDEEAEQLKARLILQGLVDQRGTTTRSGLDVKLLKHAWARDIWTEAVSSKGKTSVSMRKISQVFITHVEADKHFSDGKYSLSSIQDSFERNLDITKDTKGSRVLLRTWIRVSNRYASLHVMYGDMNREAETVTAFLEMEDSLVDQRLKLIRDLAKLNLRTGKQLLLDIIEDKEEPSYARVGAVYHLSKIPDLSDEYVDAMLTTLSTSFMDVGEFSNVLTNRFVKAALCFALGARRYEPAAPVLGRLYEEDLISNVRDAAAAALKLFKSNQEVAMTLAAEDLLKEFKSFAKKKSKHGNTLAPGDAGVAVERRSSTGSRSHHRRSSSRRSSQAGKAP